MNGEPETESERRLSVIMFSDIVGYSKMMHAHEDHAMELLNRHNKIVREALKKHDGTEVKVIGDAFLVSFTTVTDAVRCAIDIQETFSKYNEDKPTNEKILLRIGIHMGDIIVKENDVFGDGVNIASRIEPLAEPGGICISQEIYNMVRHKIDFEAVSLGPKELKNIKEKIGIYEILIGSIAERTKRRARRKKPFYKQPVAWIALGLVIVAAAILIIMALRRNPEPSSVMITRMLKIPSPKIISSNISFDGNWVVYIAQDVKNASPNLYVMPVSGGEPKKITNDTMDFIKDTPCFSLDASRIIYHRVFFGPDTVYSDLYVVPALGGTSRRIIGNADFVTLSPDGNRIAFIRSDDGKEGSELCIANADGSGEKIVTIIIRRPIIACDIAWSPDSKRLAFLRGFSTPAKERYREIFIRDLKDSSDRQVTFDKKIVDDICWASTGEIIFNSTRGNNVNLWVIPDGGGTPKQLTLGAGEDRVPHISKDAKHLVYVNESRTSNLWTMDLEMGQLQQLTYEDTWIISPVYSPGGTKLLYNRFDISGQTQLLICNNDGSEASELKPAIENYTLDVYSYFKEWFQDDRTILFNAFRRDTVRKNPDSIVVKYAFFQYDLLTNAARKIGDGELIDASRDGRYILSRPTRSKQLVTLALKTTPDKPLKEITYAWMYPRIGATPVFSFDSKNVIALDSVGVWYIPVEEGKPKRLIRRLTKYFSFVHETRDGKSLLGMLGNLSLNKYTLVKLHITGGEIEKIMELTGQENLSFSPLSPLSPDGKTLVFTKSETKNRIVVLDNFR